MILKHRLHVNVHESNSNTINIVNVYIYFNIPFMVNVQSELDLGLISLKQIT